MYSKEIGIKMYVKKEKNKFQKEILKYGFVMLNNCIVFEKLSNILVNN